MADLTSRRGLTRPTVGGDNNAWGTMLRDTITALDGITGQVLTLHVTGSANIVLTTAQSQSAVIKLVGTPAANIAVSFGTGIGGIYLIDAQFTGSYSVIFNTVIYGSTGVTFLPGMRAEVYSDATNVYLVRPRDVGQVCAFPAAVTFGFLECDGSTFSSILYPDLAAYLGGTTLPDYRGEFLRGWDHGRNVDTGRTLGSFQDQAVIAHVHSTAIPDHYHVVTAGAHTHDVTAPNHTHGFSITRGGNGDSDDGKVARGDSSGRNPYSGTTAAAGGFTVTSTSSGGFTVNSSNVTLGTINSSSYGGTETRPRNRAVIYGIRW